MADPGSGPDSDKQKGDFGAPASGIGPPSGPGKVGPNSGSDATKELARNEAERNRESAAQAAMNAKNFHPGLANAMYGTKYGAIIAGAKSFKQFAADQGITADNGFGKQGVFSKFLGLDPKNLKYKNINNAAIAYNNYSKFINPTNDPNLPGYNNQFETAEPGQLRKGLQTLFTTPETYYGPVQSNYLELDPLGAAMFAAVGLGGLPGVGLLAPKEYGIVGSPFTPDFQKKETNMYSGLLRGVTGIGIEDASKGIESLSDRLRSALSPDTASSPVKSVTEQGPVQGFEDAKSQFSTGVTRPETTMQKYDPEAGQVLGVFSQGVGQFLGQPTQQKPVPGLNNIGLY